MENQKLKFGWMILGFFFPLVGLILFLVWLKNKKGDAKSAGIGALIGGILCILLGVLAVLFFVLGIGSKVEKGLIRTVQVKQDSTFSLYSIKDNYYSINWSEYYYEDMGKDHTIKAVNEKNKELFSILKEGDKKYLVTTSKDKVELTSILVLSSYHFYYTGDALIFDTNDDFNDFYIYDYKSKKLIHAFNGVDGQYKGLYVSDIKLDNNKNLVFKGSVSTLDDENYSSGRSSIALRYENGTYKSLEELQADLTKNGLDNFVISADFTYNYLNNSYSATPVVEEEKIIDAFKKKIGEPSNIQIERTKDCTGIVTKGSNNVHELVFKENTDKTCKTVSYKVNDDFTVKYELSDGNNYVAFEKYVNGKKIDEGMYPEFDAGWTYYVSGKTLITHEWTTDLGANVYLVNTKGEVYNVVNNENKLKYDYMTEKGYKVNADGNLVISGVRHNNQCEYGLTVNGKCTTDNICDGYNAFLNKNGITEDYEYKADFTYKLNSNGQYNFDYSNKKTIMTFKEYYNSNCN